MHTPSEISGRRAWAIKWYLLELKVLFMYYYYYLGYCNHVITLFLLVIFFYFFILSNFCLKLDSDCYFIIYHNVFIAINKNKR